MFRLFAAIRSIGIGGLVRSVRYSIAKSLLERQYPQLAQRGEPVTPGSLQDTQAQPGGARYRFQRMELELQFLAHDVLRVTWGPATLPVPYALVETKWTPPPVRLANHSSGCQLSSDAVTVEVSHVGRLVTRDRAGNVLREEEPPTQQGEAVLHRVLLRPEEHIYGLGNRGAPFNLRGNSFVQWNRDPGAGTRPGEDPIYLCIPVYCSLHGAGSYLIFYENSHRAEFRFDDHAGAAFDGGALRYYLIVGSPARALERYGELTGRPEMPPRWALGYHQSRWSYASEQEVREVADGFRDRALPLSAIHLDIDYMDGFRVFTLHPQRFGNFATLARDLAAEGIALVTILDPGVKRDPEYAVYRSGRANGVFCNLPDDREMRAPVWPGWCAFPDFTDPRARDWWGDQYPPLLEAGVAGVWHDMNEPATFVAWGDPTLPRAVRHTMDGRVGDHAEAHNLFGLLMDRAGHEALRRLRPERRPFILTRSGWAGVQRYAWTWTGDVETSWRSLRQTISTMLGLGLSGIPYSGPDIGGFGGAPSGELYIRWFQLAAFLPFFRTHSSKVTPRREPWSFGPETLAIVRQYLELRYRLLPYLYTLAWEASTLGHPFVRPLFWLDARDQSLWDIEDAFLLGDVLLVAPVLQPGATSREVTLPSGLWYDFHDERQYRGPGRITLDAPLGRMPLLARAGSVIPLEDPGAAGRGAQLALHLYGGADGGGLLYSDAGDGYGPGRLDRFGMRGDKSRLVFTRTNEGSYPLPYREVALCVHEAQVRRAVFDGKEVPGKDNCFVAKLPAEAVFEF